jgi:hypothetical protein
MLTRVKSMSKCILACKQYFFSQKVSVEKLFLLEIPNVMSKFSSLFQTNFVKNKCFLPSILGIKRCFNIFVTEQSPEISKYLQCKAENI